MNTTHQPQQPPTRDPACCGTCAAIVSALTPEQPVKAPGQGGDIFLTPEMVVAHKAFMAGWKAAREGDQSGPLR